MQDPQSRTEISQLGEFGLIERLTTGFEPKLSNTWKGIGDDAAGISVGEQVVLTSTDLLTEGVHFDLSYTPLKHLGYKAVIVNLSDIAAMNAVPDHILVSLAVSNRFSVEALEELYDGIRLACDLYNIDLIGGDTTSSLSGLTISVTAFGIAPEKLISSRLGANEGDLLVVSGDLGAAYMGLQLLEREKQVFEAAPQAQPKLEGADYQLERQLKPEARVDVVRKLRELDLVPTSMIDISDGLASEIFHLTSTNHLGCQLYEEKIPIDKSTYDLAREFNLDPTVCALSGGEDYELLFTIPQADFEKVKNHPDFSVIGHMTDAKSGNQLVTKSGVQTPLTAQGWDGLKTS
ncbi:MAG: thiamine-phosphate kinase [Flavobacteriales bacterium]